MFIGWMKIASKYLRKGSEVKVVQQVFTSSQSWFGFQEWERVFPAAAPEMPRPQHYKVSI